ncbi:MAG: hypothetical protein NTX52_11795 [Planctomycetota bacterium]|nr:hypothetical protein [Planctomycetota bacterium]
MNAMSLKKMIVAIALVGISAGYIRADKMQLQEKLSKDVKIQLKDVTIAEVLEKIGQKAGVKFVLSDEAAWKLPYGEATRLSVALDGPLADSMTEMLNAFFMRYAVGDEEVTIYPRPEMEHILGRPTTKQLELLKAIYTRPIKVYFLDQLQKTINESLGREILISPIDVHAQLNNLLCQLAGKEPIYQIGGRGRPSQREFVKLPEPNEPQITEFKLPTPVTLVQLLSQVMTEDRRELGYWYISGMGFPGQSPEVCVVSSQTFRGLKLNQKVDISYKDEHLDKIFQDLASRAGVELVVIPGSRLHEYTLSANMQNITISQAVLNIGDMVGAQCDSRGNIQISGPGPKNKPAPKAAPSKPDDGGYVGKISIPMDGGKYFLEFMLRESNLTEELKKLRTEKMKEILGDVPAPKPVETPKE